MSCYTCELGERRDRGEAPLWDRIARAPHWDVGHAFDTSIEGWLVLVLRRHAASVADLLDTEAASLGPLIADASRALERVMGSAKVYVAQFAEHPLHPHVHFHLIARPRDLATGGGRSRYLRPSRGGAGAAGERRPHERDRRRRAPPSRRSRMIARRAT